VNSTIIFYYIYTNIEDQSIVLEYEPMLKTFFSLLYSLSFNAELKRTNCFFIMVVFERFWYYADFKNYLFRFLQLTRLTNMVFLDIH